MSSDTHTESSFLGHDPLAVRRLVAVVLFAAVLWGAAGAILTPILVISWKVPIDRAIALVAIYMGVFTTALELLVLAISRATVTVETSRTSAEDGTSARLWSLVWLTILGLLAAFAFVVSLGALGVIFILGFEWAISGALVMSALTFGISIAALLSVPMLVFLYSLVEHLDNIASTMSTKMALVFMMSTVVITAQLSGLSLQAWQHRAVAAIRHS